MTTALEGGEWSAACHGSNLPPGKTRYPFYRRLGGPQGRSGRAENLVPTGTRLLIEYSGKKRSNLSLRLHSILRIRLEWKQRHVYALSQKLGQYTYLLTPWCRVLLEKLTGLQLVKKFPAFHGTRRFITALTSVRHLSLSWASPIQSIYRHPNSWRSILLSTHLRLGLPSGLLPSGFPSKTLYTPSPHPYAPHAQPISLFSILSPTQYWASTNH